MNKSGVLLLPLMLSAAAPSRAVGPPMAAPRGPFEGPTYPDHHDVTPREGLASWYGPRFHGRRTACGETFDQEALTAAHRTLPFGTLIAVTNVATGSSVTLRINDRGPYVKGRILDCSRAAAEHLGYLQRGVARVRWEVVRPQGVAATPKELPAAECLPAEPSS